VKFAHLPAIICLFAPAVSFASVISGEGRPIDGDSLRVGNQEIRLYGIDAPEFTQSCSRDGQRWHCGKSAADQLTKLIGGQLVSCSSMGQDEFGRTLARCRAGEVDLNRTMVATGYALAYRRYSMDYVSAEDSAKLAKRGIWSGSFELPSEVRHAGEDYKIEQPAAADRNSNNLPVVVGARGKAPAGGNCRIKGNHSRRGELIYHLPGMPYYAETRAEQMFCSEAEARAAGYRRSRADQHR